MTSPYGALSDELEGRVKLTKAQMAFLDAMPKDGGWRYFSIIRSGTAKAEVAIRQQLRRRGLVEHSPNPRMKRSWRITDAGRAALRSHQTGDAK